MATIEHHHANINDLIRLLQEVRSLYDKLLSELPPLGADSKKNSLIYGDFPEEDVEATKLNILTNVKDGTQIHIEPEYALWACLPKPIWVLLALLQFMNPNHKLNSFSRHDSSDSKEELEERAIVMKNLPEVEDNLRMIDYVCNTHYLEQLNAMVSERSGYLLSYADGKEDYLSQWEGNELLSNLNSKEDDVIYDSQSKVDLSLFISEEKLKSEIQKKRSIAQPGSMRRTIWSAIKSKK